MEHLGTPTVSIVTDFFMKEANWISDAEGVGALSIVEIPHHPSMDRMMSGEIRAKAKAILDEVVDGMTQANEADKQASEKLTIKPEPESIVVRGSSNTEALSELNDLFYREKWTDGFPVVPPTHEAVERMLEGTKLDPEEMIGLVPPRMGKASIRKIAISAVMAGAEPAYMPVIITAVEAILDPAFATGWGAAGMQATTSTATPLLIINGPIARELDIASGVDCFGRGHRANATIGRALRLILTNIGGSQPGINDMKSQGNAQEFTFCVAENEDHPAFHSGEKSWKPLNVERGFSPGTSTITAFATWTPMCLNLLPGPSNDSKYRGLEGLYSVADSISSMGQLPYELYWEYILVLSSTSAQGIVDAGFSKDDIRNYLYANSVVPWSKYKQHVAHLGPRLPWIPYTANDTTAVHIYGSPENVNVIVAGGEGYSQIVRAHSTGVTKPIVEVGY